MSEDDLKASDRSNIDPCLGLYIHLDGISDAIKFLTLDSGLSNPSPHNELLTAGLSHPVSSFF